jgi:hypothetical protein
MFSDDIFVYKIDAEILGLSRKVIWFLSRITVWVGL